MADIPHLTVPFRIRRGTALTVEQDTRAEIRQCVRVLVATLPGERSLVPAYGLADLAFTDPDDAPQAIAEAVREWEPRATVDDVAQTLAEHSRLDVSVDVETR